MTLSSSSVFEKRPYDVRGIERVIGNVLDAVRRRPTSLAPRRRPVAKR
jgi:hypothetical protein